MLTFEQFIATRREVPCLEAATRFGFDPGTPGYVYESDLHIELRGSAPVLTLFCDEYRGPLADLERRLFEFYSEEF